MENVIKKCKICGSQFDKKPTSRKIYCSNKCSNKSNSLKRSAKKKQLKAQGLGIPVKAIEKPINENELNYIKKENESLRIELSNTQKRLSQLTHEFSFFRLLTIKQMANILKITPKTVHKLIETYDVPVIKVSERKTLIRYTDYLELLDMFE